MAVIGNSSTQQAFTPAIDYFSGNGSTTAFTLSRPVASVAQVQVTIDNVAQNPSSAYTVSSNTITFTSAPLSGTNNIYVYYTSPITDVIAPGQGTVGATALDVYGGAGVGAMNLPSGTTAQRPGSPTTGATRYNTTLAQVETYDGTNWSIVKSFFSATGGTITTSGSYKYHTFTSSGNFVVSLGSATVEYLIIAGGGAAGSYAGGGGAGGFVYGAVAVTATTYAVTVGAGGTNASGISPSQSVGSNGSNSSAFSVSATGGGGGGNGSTSGSSGGSGGGGGYNSSGGSGTSGQGYAGGSSVNSNPYPSGGGGGATAVGTNASGLTAGSGGAGTSAYSVWATATSTGVSGAYAGGGGGGVSSGGAYTSGGVAGAGGAGGGGNGGVGGTGVTAGTANTGGGGGSGGYLEAGNYNPRSGGSGIVIIRYLV